MIAKNQFPADANPRFQLGKTLATPGAIKALTQAGQEPIELLTRHVIGDWGDVAQEDRYANEVAVADGTRIFSVYTLKTSVKVWVVSEADRSATTILLPDEY